jgi:uncharacterized membrane protein
MSETWLEIVRVVVAVGAGATGGALWVFSVMVLPAFDRLRPGEAVASFQRINEAAQRPGFLSVFLGTALGALAVAVLAIMARGDNWLLHLVGALLYLVTVAITGSVNVPANNRLATMPPDELGAPGAWAHFTRVWRPANHARSLTALAGALLLAWP